MRANWGCLFVLLVCLGFWVAVVEAILWLLP